jgi:hypothetical protein
MRSNHTDTHVNLWSGYVGVNILLKDPWQGSAGITYHMNLLNIHSIILAIWFIDLFVFVCDCNWQGGKRNITEVGSVSKINEYLLILVQCRNFKECVNVSYVAVE